MCCYISHLTWHIDSHAPQAFSPLQLDKNPTNIQEHLSLIFSSKGYNRHSVPGQMTVHSEVYQLWEHDYWVDTLDFLKFIARCYDWCWWVNTCLSIFVQVALERCSALSLKEIQVKATNKVATLMLAAASMLVSTVTVFWGIFDVECDTPEKQQNNVVIWV